MDFQRYDGFLNSSIQKKFDKELPLCPFCGESPHWKLNVQNGFNVISATCMCEKCKAKLNTEYKILNIKKLKIVGLGEKNIHDLELNNTYSLEFLQELPKIKTGHVQLNENSKKITRDTNDNIKPDSCKLQKTQGYIGFVVLMMACIFLLCILLPKNIKDNSMSVSVFIVLMAVLFVVLIKLINKQRKEKIESNANYLVKNGFNVDKVVTSNDNKLAVYIDTKKEQWCFYNLTDNFIKILPYGSLLDFEIVENGETIIQGRAGSALIGGALFGEIGAIVGASRSKVINTNCTNLSIKLNINDIDSPLISFTLLNKTVEKTSAEYKNAYKNALEFEAILKIILTNGKLSQPVKAVIVSDKNTNLDKHTASDKEKLQELKEMLDDGLITQEDFEQKKKQILGL